MSIITSIISALRTIFSGPAKHITAEISYLQPNGLLTGKKIIITGGGRGLGASMAEKFVREGAQVLIAGRTEKTIKDTLDWLRYGLQKTDASTASVFCIVLIKIYRKTLAHIRIVLYLYICNCNIWLENALLSGKSPGRLL